MVSRAEANFDLGFCIAHQTRYCSTDILGVCFRKYRVEVQLPSVHGSALIVCRLRRLSAVHVPYCCARVELKVVKYSILRYSYDSQVTWTELIYLVCCVLAKFQNTSIGCNSIRLRMSWSFVYSVLNTQQDISWSSKAEAFMRCWWYENCTGQEKLEGQIISGARVDKEGDLDQ